MKLSYNWLCKYVALDGYQSPSEVAQLLTGHSFEVESVEAVDQGRDYVFDVSVLPNRAHDCLSHRGIAQEIAALLGTRVSLPQHDTTATITNSLLSASVDDATLCPRYSAAVIQGVSVGPSPQWLVELLTAIGQKSINNIVDATNYVMFALGQPLHAFDCAQLIAREGVGSTTYSLRIRESVKGESVEALDGKTYTLPVGTLVITDAHCKDNKILGIAGIKGGTAAEITTDTRAVVIESANFDPIAIRTSAKALGLRTDASVRFENGITPHLTYDALQEVCQLICEIAGGEIVGTIDVHEALPARTEITLPFADVEGILGLAISPEKIISLLKALRCDVEECDGGVVVRVPHDRLDLVIPQDLVEEVGRLHGYTQIPPRKPEEAAATEVTEADSAAAAFSARVERVRDVLAAAGFSEVYTYTFRDTGARELANPIASDKAYVRANLIDGVIESMALNTYNAPLLQIYDAVRVFEIGTVFDERSEHVSLCCAIAPVKKVKKADEVFQGELATLCARIASTIGASEIPSSAYAIIERNGVYALEIQFEHVCASLPHDVSYTHTLAPQASRKTYTRISQYPFMLRDIAIFVPADTDEALVRSVIQSTAGDLLVSLALFDVFTKQSEDGTHKTSYAYKLVFQSSERTLSDVEVGEIMQRVTDALHAHPQWLVR